MTSHAASLSIPLRPEPPTAAQGASRPARRRLDIQGLRAVCMIQVLLFHAWGVGSPIGVDAFITISAFLMTGSFVRRSEAGRMPAILERWANTFKRLLPPLVVVVLATVVGTWLVLPRNRWGETLIQAFASVTYWENWRLVEVAADYYANDHAASSPLQHLWSMSMQGQIFLLWPVIMTVCVLLARATGRRIRSVVFWAFATLTIGSLIWLLVWAPDNGGVYFDTRARIWEFSFGSAIAAIAPRLRLSAASSRIFGWAGLVVLLVYCLVDIGTYPGPMAVVPMAAVSAVLVANDGEDSRGVARVLGVRPLVLLGNASYAVYLVHWPLFVFFLNARGHERLGIRGGVAMIALSLIVAFLVARFVDDPMRNWVASNATAARKSVVVVASLALGLAPLAWSMLSYEHMRSREMIASTGAGSEENPGARVLLGTGVAGYTSSPLPGPFALDSDWGRLPDQCGFEELGLAVGDNAYCSQQGDPKTASARVVIGGDSHTQQILLPQLTSLAGERGWLVTMIHKGACSWGQPDAYDGDCALRNARLLDYVERVRPDYVFLVVTASEPDGPRETLRPGVEGLTRQLTAEGVSVIGVRDTLRSRSDLYECSLGQSPDELYGGCLLDRAQYVAEDNPADVLDDIDGYQTIDMTDAYCTDDVCPTIIGNIHVYLDNNHLTATYSETVAPFFAERVEDALDLG